MGHTYMQNYPSFIWVSNLIPGHTNPAPSLHWPYLPAPSCRECWLLMASSCHCLLGPWLKGVCGGRVLGSGCLAWEIKALLLLPTGAICALTDRQEARKTGLLFSRRDPVRVQCFRRAALWAQPRPHLYLPLPGPPSSPPLPFWDQF